MTLFIASSGHLAVSAFLKGKMKESEITYAELVRRLKKNSLKETEAGITMKLKRRAFSATFFLACLARPWNWMA